LFRVTEISLTPIGALEPPARDVFLRHGTLITATEIHSADAEEADPLVRAARLHRLLWKPNDAPVGDDALCLLRRRAGTAATTAPAGCRASSGHACLRRFDLDVVRKRDRSLDIRAVGVDLAANRRDLRDVRREQTRHVDDSGAIGTVRVD